MRTPRPNRKLRVSLGFTLFEVLGVVLVTALLLGAAINFFLNLTRQAARATESTREVRRAAALVDRIATDLEHTLLVKKPADADPLSRPWLFVAESRYSLPGAQRGSDQIKFIRRDVPRASEGSASVVAMVAYTLQRSEDGDRFELHRWSRSELPESLEREFPRSDDPASLLVADDLSYFALRFLDESGQWQEDWDSTLLIDSGELPIAVEIEVALAAPEGSASDAEPELDEPKTYTRVVELPLRPIDIEALLNPEEGTDVAQNDDDADGANGGRTIADCIDVSKLTAATGLSQSDIATLQAAIANTPAASLAPYTSALAALSASGAVKSECL